MQPRKEGKRLTILDLAEYKPVRADALPPLVLCLGTFDGVHRGHAALIDETCRRAALLRAEIPHVRAGAWCFAVPPYEIAAVAVAAGLPLPEKSV